MQLTSFTIIDFGYIPWWRAIVWVLLIPKSLHFQRISL